MHLPSVIVIGTYVFGLLAPKNEKKILENVVVRKGI